MMNPTEEIETDVVVIGAGLTGLTTAYYLHKNDCKFIVLERQNRVGGVIQSRNENGFLYEEGPNTGVTGNATVVELFDDLTGECKPEAASEYATKRFILKNSRWEHLPRGLMEAINTPLFSLKDKFRILAEPFRPAGKNPHENLAAFVKRRLGNSYLNYAIDPFIIGVYAGDPNYLIPKYALPKLYDLEQKYGSLIGGSIKKGLENKPANEKKVTKKVFSFTGGLGSLTHALYESSGIENFRFGSEEVTVETSGEGFTVRYLNQNGEICIIKTKKVISTIGAYSLESTLPFIEPEEMKKLNSLLYTKVIEVSLGFNHWQGIDLDGFGGLIPSLENRNLLGILYMSSLFKNRAPEGGALLSIFMGGVRRQELMHLSDSEIGNLVEKECKELLKLKDFKPDLFKIMRHNWAIPQYGVESGERFATIKQLEKQYQGLQIGGNLSNGIGMADRIRQGKELAIRAIQIKRNDLSSE